MPQVNNRQLDHPDVGVRAADCWLGESGAQRAGDRGAAIGHRRSPAALRFVQRPTHTRYRFTAGRRRTRGAADDATYCLRRLVNGNTGSRVGDALCRLLRRQVLTTAGAAHSICGLRPLAAAAVAGLQDEVLETEVAYWKERLADARSQIDLPTD